MTMTLALDSEKEMDRRSDLTKKMEKITINFFQVRYRCDTDVIALCLNGPLA